MIKKDNWADHYTRRARKENWLARSFYKLEEIDKSFKIIRSGHRLLDLGCYPGSWSQYGLKGVGPRGEVTGLDVKEPTHLSATNFRFVEADVLTIDPHWLLEQIGLQDAVISDLAPQTTGIRIADTTRSLELAEKALEITLVVLKKKGHFLCKIFEGEELKAFRDQIGVYFDRTRLIRPSAVRRGSREVYALGLGRLKKGRRAFA